MIAKKIIIPAIAITVIGAAAMVGTTQAYAQTPQSGFSGLVQMIAQKFGLDQSQVQSAVDTYKQQQSQNMQKNMVQHEQDRLTKLVQEGKITDAQKQAILDEQAKLKTEYSPESFKSMTPDQRKQAFQKEQAEIKSWAQSQGINASYLMPVAGGFRRAGDRWLNKHNPSQSPTPTPQS